MTQIVRANMRTKQVTREPVPEEYKLLGGRGLNARILIDDVDPRCEPLGAKNKLVISPGMFAGTNVSSASRLSFGGKSPLTGGIKEANTGGNNGFYLARLGIKSVIIEDIAETGELYILYLGADRDELLPADNLRGKNVYETGQLLREKFGDVGVACIGPAGEQLLAAAGIANTNREGVAERFAARGGLGAVMGSKGLKAIVIEKHKSDLPRIEDIQTFNSARKVYHDMVRNNPGTGPDGCATWGTAALLDPINAAGDICVKNMRMGQWDKCPTAADVHKNIVEHGGKHGHPCMTGCIVRCSNQYPAKDGNILCKLDYESIALLGPNLMISDLDTIARLNRKINEVGLDTMETGGALGVAMEADVIKWGDGEGALKLIEEVSEGTPLGKIIGSGSLMTGKVFGVRRIPVVKGQTWAGYDPRASKGQGVTYCTTPQGADHNSGYVVGAEVLKAKRDLDPFSTKDKGKWSYWYQRFTATFDTLGFCTIAADVPMIYDEALEAVVIMLNAMYGTDFDKDTIFRLGEQTLKYEREFNRRAGFSKVHDRPPEFIVNEPLPPHNHTFDVPEEELDAVFKDIV